MYGVLLILSNAFKVGAKRQSRSPYPRKVGALSLSKHLSPATPRTRWAFQPSTCKILRTYEDVSSSISRGGMGWAGLGMGLGVIDIST